jgi:predicted DNA-binding transcriptional regulator YafY
MTTPATPSTQTEQLVSLPAAAAKLDVSLRSLYRLIALREIAPPIKVMRSSKLFISDLDSYLHRLKSQRK